MSWNAWALPGIVAMLVAVTLAGLVRFTGPPTRQSRLLALALFLEGMGAGTSTGLVYLMDSPTAAWGIQAIGVTAFLALPFLYLAFLGTLDTAIVKPFAHAWSRIALFVGVIGLEIFWLVRSDLFVGGMVRTAIGWESQSGPLVRPFNNFASLVYLFALVVALFGIRAAPTRIARRRAAAFAVAFGIRDLLRLLLILSLNVWPPAQGGVGDLRFILALPVLTLTYVPVLAYGILKTRLFDIDLRLKRTLSQSTLAAIFIAVFFAVSEAAATFFGDTTGSTYLGIGAAALLVFALAPLQRFTQGLSDRAMPKVEATPEYLTYKKLEVYRATLEGAYEDGVVSPRERAVFDRVRAKLGITPADAQALEDEVRAAIGAPAPSPAATPDA